MQTLPQTRTRLWKVGVRSCAIVLSNEQRVALGNQWWSGRAQVALVHLEHRGDDLQGNNEGNA